MKDLIKKYTDRLNTIKENRAETCDNNTDAENEKYDLLVKHYAEMVRDLKTEDQKRLDILNWAKSEISGENKVKLGKTMNPYRIEKINFLNTLIKKLD